MVTPKPLRLRYPDVYLTPLWPTLLRPRPDGIPRFKATTTSALFAAAGYELPASLEPWWAYISKRYSGGPFCDSSSFLLLAWWSSAFPQPPTSRS